MDKRAVSSAMKIVRAMLREWDPIGVYHASPQTSEDPWPDDEYDSYAPRVLGHLDDGSSAAVLGEYLHVVRTEMMGLSPNRTVDERFAQRMIDRFATETSK